MMNVAVYQVETGRVVQTMSVRESDLEGYLPAFGLDVLPAPDGLDPFAHYVDDAEFIPIPPRPSAFHVFDYTIKNWLDARTLEDHKAAKWAEIRAARDAAEFGGFTWDGSAFDSDPMSQSRIQGAAQLAQLSPAFSVDWTLADNNVRTLTGPEMIAVGVELGVHVSAQHAAARTLRAQILAATTAAEVEAVVWPD